MASYTTFTTRRYTETPFSLVNLLFDLVEALLLVRFAFKFLQANALHWFVRGLYGLTEPLVAPFRGIFPDRMLGGMFFEWGTILAMIAYALLGLVLLRLLTLLAVAISGEHDEEHEEHHVHRHA